MRRIFRGQVRHQQRSWSIARRLFGISILLILSQALVSTLVTDQLRDHYFREHLEKTLDRQIVSSYNVISDRLDQMSVDQAYECCSIQDYRSWLRGLRFENGKVGLIVGDAGLQATLDAENYYDTAQLSRYAKAAIATPNGFAINAAEDLAIKAVKLPGGSQTGFYVYMRPVYSMPLVHTFMFIKLVSELVLMLLLALALLVSLRQIFRPVRRIQSELASIELNQLECAGLSSRNRPREFQPLLEEFNEMVGRLRRSSANQKQFASTISHEFRTPMTVVSGFIQSVLNRDEGLRSQSKDALTLANREVLRLNRMLSDLLDLSRADNNQLKVLREPFDALVSCQDVLRFAEVAYPDNVIEFEKSLFNQPVYAVGDPDRLVQCLKNLIGNAVKYSPLGSEINLAIDVNTSHVIFSVKDRGQGIPQDQQERIFERFERADGVTLRRGDSSSGLGLSIVKMLMEGMGGSVHVQSQVGIGSKFILILQRSMIDSNG